MVDIHIADKVGYKFQSFSISVEYELLHQDCCAASVELWNCCFKICVPIFNFFERLICVNIICGFCSTHLLYEEINNHVALAVHGPCIGQLLVQILSNATCVSAFPRFTTYTLLAHIIG